MLGLQYVIVFTYLCVMLEMDSDFVEIFGIGHLSISRLIDD